MKYLSLFAVLCVLFSSCEEKDKKQETVKSETTESASVKFKALEDVKLESGKLLRVKDFPSKYIKPRPVDVWIPENYSSDKEFSVLYMHDGQMLFDSTSTWNKQEWKVDEWASKLMKQDKTRNFIVVAIHNIADIRWQDLFPQKAFELLEKSIQESLLEEAVNANFDTKFNGNNYLRFLVKELKPIIDKQFAVHNDAANTFVAGSSMGGLMSMYAVSEYPETFGGAACLSTHWPGAAPKKDNPIPNAIFDYMKANLPEAGSHKLYFDYGNKTLDEHYPQYASRVDEILEAKGYTNQDFKNIFFEGTDHSEKSWQKRLDQPLLFLLGKD